MKTNSVVSPAVRRFQMIKAMEKERALTAKGLPERIKAANPNRTERALEALVILARDARR